MSNGKQQQQQSQLTRADIRAGVKEGVSGVENKIDNLRNEVRNLNERVNKIERSKLEGRVNALENIKPHLEKLQDDAKKRAEEEEEVIQSKYDENMNELIERFVDKVQTNTETVDLIREEYENITNIRDSMFDDLESLGGVYTFNYRVRKKRLKDKRESIENNFEEFLTRRKNVKDLIDSLKSDFRNEEPIKLHVPVWVCGTEDGTGSEKIRIYTPSSIERGSTKQLTPSQPYIEHFEQMLNKIKDEITDLSLEEKKRAKEESIIKPRSIRDLCFRLEKLKEETNFIDANLGEEGDSLFINKLKKFLMDKSGGSKKTVLDKGGRN